jgi:VWFA-related protein
MTTHVARGIVLFVVRFSASLALGLVAIAASAQDAPQPPNIHISTHLVQIGIIVHDRNGPVGNLTKDDFVVLDRGKPQKIGVFSVESGDSAPQPAEPLPKNTFSDLPRYGTSKPRSVTIVLLDNLNTLSGSSPLPYETTPYWVEDHALAFAKQHLIEFLKQRDSMDLIAIYGLRESLHVLCDFTCNRDQLLAVVTKYDPTSKTQREAVETGTFHTPVPGPEFNGYLDSTARRFAALNNEAREQATMSALTAIAAHVADIPGRKNLLWLTANLPFSAHSIALILNRANIAAYPVDARGLLPRTSPAYSGIGGPVGGEVRRVLGIDDTSSQTDQPIGIGEMEQIAEETGGRAFVNTNDITGAIQKAVEDSAVTYTLGFYLEPSSLDGNFHELKVEVRRSGLNVLYPKGYFALKDTPATQDERRNRFLTVFKSPLGSSAIPLQVTVDRVNQPTPNSLSLFGSIGILDLRLVQTGEIRAGSLDITVIEQDETGKVLRESTNRIDLRFTEGQYAAALKSGIHFRKPLQPRAGAIVLRVLVQDPSTAAIGNLIIPLSQLK